MADYPWGGMSPQKRIGALEASIKANDEKKASAVEAHRRKVLEFDETDRSLRADLRTATGIAERERKESNKADAVRILERLAAGGFDLEAAIKTGILEKHLQTAVEAAVAEAATAPVKGAAKGAPKAKRPEGAGQQEPGEVGAAGADPAVTPIEA